jgi:hypothetical protein
VSCQVDGAPETVGAQLEVVPAKPARLIVGRRPDEPVYGIGQVITIETVVTDIYDNIIPDAQIAFVSTPAGESFGQGRVRYPQEGTYTVVATVQGDTHDGMALSGSVQIIVNSTGPAINCQNPADGEMLTATPGNIIKFNGSVGDTNGISSLKVNGQDVTVGTTGAFEHNVNARYGINFVDVVAKDAFGVENSRTCAFLVSEVWTTENSFLDSSISLRLAQAAIDDRNPNTGLNSLNDVLVRVLNSMGLRTTLHQGLLAANPIKPSSCDQGGPFGTCLLRSEVTYLNSQINGPNTSELTLVAGGLNLKVRIGDIRVQLRIRGHVSGINYDTTGWVTVQFVEVDLTSNFQLTNNQPRITLRQINAVNVGNVSTNFSGLSGAIIDIVAVIAQGTIRNLVRDLIRDYVNQEFNALLDGIVGGLDISTLGSTFNVPKLDGTGTIALGFGVRFSTLTVTTVRALFGIGTRFTAPINRPGMTRGAPRPAGEVLLDNTTTQPASIAIQVGLLNQVLHTLWRAGYFDVNLGGAALSGLPDGSEVLLALGLPPVALLENNRVVRLHLGSARLTLRYPGLFDEPLVLSLGATATSTVTLNGDDLVFGNIEIDELYFSPEGLTLNATNRDILEQFLKRVLQNVLNQSLNGALPALPIPSFELPPTVSQFGLPAGAQLGIRNPALSNTIRHLILNGAFGVR